MKRVIFILIVTVLVLNFTSCGNPYVDEAVVGKWSRNGAVLTLGGDGYYTIETSGERVTGAYTTEDGYITVFPDNDPLEGNSVSYRVYSSWDTPSPRLVIGGDSFSRIG